VIAASVNSVQSRGVAKSGLFESLLRLSKISQGLRPIRPS
jgi:hypothetical protein